MSCIANRTEQIITCKVTHMLANLDKLKIIRFLTKKKNIMIESNARITKSVIYIRMKHIITKQHFLNGGA